MAELKPCPFCGKKEAYLTRNCYGQNYVRCPNCGAVVWGNDNESLTEKRAIELWNTRTPKEEKPKVTCVNCKHLMFSDMYGECNKQLKIVNPSDTCEFAEPKERGEQNES